MMDFVQNTTDSVRGWLCDLRDADDRGRRGIWPRPREELRREWRVGRASFRGVRFPDVFFLLVSWIFRAFFIRFSFVSLLAVTSKWRGARAS